MWSLNPSSQAGVSIFQLLWVWAAKILWPRPIHTDLPWAGWGHRGGYVHHPAANDWLSQKVVPLPQGSIGSGTIHTPVVPVGLG